MGDPYNINTIKNTDGKPLFTVVSDSTTGNTVFSFELWENDKGIMSLRVNGALRSVQCFDDHTSMTIFTEGR